MHGQRLREASSGGNRDDKSMARRKMPNEAHRIKNRLLI
jgi:hypothetical protein